MAEEAGSRPRACFNPPRALSRDVTECRSGITARALAAPRDGAAYADGVGARSIIVRGMKHDGPPAIVRETHSREVGHGTTRGSQLYTPPRRSTLLSCRPLVSSASTLSQRTAALALLPSSPLVLFCPSPFSRSITR